MVFSSLVFLFVYLPVVLAVYYLIPCRWRNPWLFAVNLVFYGWGEPVYILLMLFSITINYISGILICRNRDDDRKSRLILTVNTVVNLSLLVLFKYADLLIGTVNSLFGCSLKALNLALPIGISFYTFQTMSYPIDVYRGDTSVQKNYVNFGTFVALFPQLIAGPIVRYKDIESQLTDRPVNTAQFADGVERFCLGLAKKVLIANNIGSLWDVHAAAAPGELTVVGAWLGAIAFSLQIYYDFSGYSDMAIGLGRMLGFEFLENFNYPYISKSVTEFWRRWHISLGTWFRDYVYIPLGGNRKGKARQFFNLLVVWALTGFWHGANWTFLCWGLYYAIFLMIEKAFLLKKLEKVPVIATVYALLVAICGWVLFDLPTLGAAAGYYKSMFGFAGGGFCNVHDLFYLRNYALILVIGAVACLPIGKNLYEKCNSKLKAWLTPVMIVFVLVVSTAYLVDATYNPFLYFRF